MGKVLKCSHLAPEQLAGMDDPEYIIRAEVIRDLLVKREDKLPDPRGVRLRGARIIGSLDLTHVQAPVGLELRACYLDQTMLVEDTRLPWLTLSGSSVPAVAGDRLRVDGDLMLSEGFCTTGGGEAGAIRLLDARIGTHLLLSGAELINRDGPVLFGDGLHVDGDLIFGNGFRAHGGGKAGTIRLPDARIGGQLLLLEAGLTNPNGPALLADRLHVDGDLIFGNGFRAHGGGEAGTIRLPDARIGVQLLLLKAGLTNPNGLVLDLGEAEAKKVFFLPHVICPKAVAGRSACDDATRRVNLNGFVYRGHGGDWRQWLHLIVRHTEFYRPQPYQQLAAVQRAAGHDSDAREILIAQEQDRHKRGTIGGRLLKTVHWVGGLCGKYGYSIDRIALTLSAFLVLAGVLGILAGHCPTSPGRYVAMHTSQAATPNTPCSLVEQIGVGIDRSLPLAPAGIRSRCDLDTISHRGQVMTVIFWVVQTIAWVLATMVVAGYSGRIRKAT